MQIKKRPTAWIVAGGLFFWNIVGQPLWNLNIERLAERQKLDSALADGGFMSWLSWLAGYVPSSFGLGFAAGALVFAYWDSLARLLPFARVKELAIPSYRPLHFWLGEQRLSVENIRRDGGFYAFVRFISVGRETACLHGPSGHIVVRLTKELGADASAILHGATVSGIEHYREIGQFVECNLTIFQPVPHDIIEQIIQTATGSRIVSIDFRAFKLDFVSTESVARASLLIFGEFDLTKGEAFIAWPHGMPL